LIRVLVAGVIAMVVSIIVGPRFIAFLRKNEFGQHIREELPERHEHRRRQVLVLRGEADADRDQREQDQLPPSAQSE